MAENSFRDVNIVFANELRSICDEKGVDFNTVRKLANRHSRVNILESGVGEVDFHCRFPEMFRPLASQDVFGATTSAISENTNR